MATKEKKAKVVKEKKAKQVAFIEVDAEKARAFEDGKYVKKGEDGKLNESLTGYVIRTMLAEKKLAINELVPAIKKAGFETKNKKFTCYDLINKLVAKKVLARYKEPAKA